MERPKQLLGADELLRFFKYKSELKEEQYAWSEAEVILNGFIWDESESLKEKI